MGDPSDPLRDIGRQLAKIRIHLADPNKPVSGTRLLKYYGSLGVASSMKAFREQKLGNYKWPARYEGQEAPEFNYAGALMDWKSGRKSPKPNRFQDRPALIDEGMRGGLQGSLTFELLGAFAVQWGTNKTYGPLHNLGGMVSISYDAATRKRIEDWLYVGGSPKSKKFGSLRQNKVKTKGGTVIRRSAYADHVNQILNRNPWVQKIAKRPFVGITSELAQDLVKATEYHYNKAQER